MMKIFRKARPHASRTSEMWNVNKRRAFCQRGTKDQGICHGLKASNFISLNQNILKTERPSSACRVPFSKAAILADNRPKSRPIRGRESAPIGVSFFSLSLFFILIDNYSSFASLFACIFSWLKGKIRFDDFFFFSLSPLLERFCRWSCPFSEWICLKLKSLVELAIKFGGWWLNNICGTL